MFQHTCAGSKCAAAGRFYLFFALLVLCKSDCVYLLAGLDSAEALLVLYEQLGMTASAPGAGQMTRGQPGLEALGWQVRRLRSVTMCQCASLTQPESSWTDDVGT
jgi:hypothetical protein